VKIHIFGSPLVDGLKLGIAPSPFFCNDEMTKGITVAGEGAGFAPSDLKFFTRRKEKEN
jgi:hypothetical protein